MRRRLLRIAAALGVAWLSSQAQAQELRDPFVFGPRSGSQAGAAMLIGVLWDATKPLAIVGEATVQVGDVVDGWRVVEIRQDGIVLEQGARQEFIAPGTLIPLE